MFRKAERKKAKLRLGISGPSGGGKTWSALEIAFGMTTGDKIFFIDTESGRGELYQGAQSKYDANIHFEYNYYRLDAPYSPERYIEALHDAEKNGCEVLIIDSLSHAWSGEGGVLSIVDKAGGQFQNGWKIGTPKQNSLIDALIHSKMHIIANLRSKTEYVVEKDDRGKNVPRKIGLAPIQRDQVEYEFTVFMNMSHDNVAHVSKDNSGIYNQEFIKPCPEMGRKLMEWLNTGLDQTEQFVQVTLPVILAHIFEADDIEELQEIFTKAKLEYSAAYKEEFKQIIEAKDRRKAELASQVVTELPPIEDMVAPVIMSKYSSSLVKSAGGMAQ